MAIWAIPFCNMGSGVDLPIRALDEMIAQVVGYQGEFEQDTSKRDGIMRKVMNVSLIRGLGWRPTIDLKTRTELAYRDFLSMGSIWLYAVLCGI